MYFKDQKDVLIDPKVLELAKKTTGTHTGNPKDGFKDDWERS